MLRWNVLYCCVSPKKRGNRRQNLYKSVWFKRCGFFFHIFCAWRNLVRYLSLHSRTNVQLMKCFSPLFLLINWEENILKLRDTTGKFLYFFLFWKKKNKREKLCLCYNNRLISLTFPPEPSRLKLFMFCFLPCLLVKQRKEKKTATERSPCRH